LAANAAPPDRLKAAPPIKSAIAKTHAFDMMELHREITPQNVQQTVRRLVSTLTGTLATSSNEAIYAV
jgi:uncharacterized ParB-like nuclease family protein